MKRILLKKDLEPSYVSLKNACKIKKLDNKSIANYYQKNKKMSQERLVRSIKIFPKKKKKKRSSICSGYKVCSGCKHFPNNTIF